MLGNVIIPAMNFRRVSRNAFTSLGQHRSENVSLKDRETGLWEGRKAKFSNYSELHAKPGYGRRYPAVCR
jgi:predicted double-glycine peptidase